ncbi:hypothetical protein EFE02_04185, partial [Pediococcus pentosaceus]|nr:hypothetical protein [Pediococcus pentosaceus]
QLLKDGFVVNTILKEADLFCPNSVRINFTIYLIKCMSSSNFVSRNLSKEVLISLISIRE